MLLMLVLLAAWCGNAAAVTVMLDPGHGGADPGAIGHALKEKELNLDIGMRVKEELAERGYRVLMTRTDDAALSLRDRVEASRKSGADLFVSIHVNAHADKRAHGSLVLYYDRRHPQPAYPASSEMIRLTEESKALAQAVLDGLVSAAGTANRGIVPSSAYVIRNGNVPSILVETAFISNAGDAALLASGDWRAKAARGIADGIARYMSPAFSDIAGHWAKPHIERLEERALVGGYEGRFAPDRFMTRAEFLVLLDRVFRYSAEPEPGAQGRQGGGETDGDGGNASPPADAGLPAAPEPAEGGAADGAHAADSGAADGKRAAENGAADGAHVPEERAFADLPPAHWAYQHLRHAVRLGIANGYEDGRFRPDDPLRRGEMAVLFDRVARLAPPEGERAMPFADVTPDSWYAAAVENLYGHGLVGGVTDAAFQPGKPLTRAEAAAVIDRFLASPMAGLAAIRQSPAG